MNAIVIETADQARFVSERIQKGDIKLSESLLLVCNYEKAAGVLESARVAFRLWEDYQIPDNPDALEEAAFALARSWYQVPLLKESLTYRGHSLGFIVERDWFYYLFALLYNLSWVGAVLAKERPREITIFKTSDRPLKNYAHFRGFDEECVFAKLFEDRGRALGIPIRHCEIEESKRPPRQPLSARLRNRFKALSKGILGKIYQPSARLKNSPKKTRRVLCSLTPDYLFSLAEALSGGSTESVCYLTDSLPVKFLPQLWQKRIHLVLAQPKSFQGTQERQDRFRELWREAEGNQELEEAFSYGPYKIWPYAAKRAAYLLQEEFPRVAGLIDFFEEALKRERISAVVVNEDVCITNRVLVLVAKALRIPSLVLQHGMAMKKPGFYPLVADRFACWGPFHRERLLRMEVPAEKIVLTGCPKYENWRLGEGHEGERAQFIRKHRLQPGKKIALYANTIFREEWKVYGLEILFTPQQMKEHIENLVQMTRKLPQYQWVIKLHPRDRHRRLVEDVLSSLNAEKDILLLQFYDTPSLLRVADVVVDPARSAVGLEALVLGKPLVRLNLDRRHDPLDFNERRVAVGVSDWRELPQALETAQELCKTPSFSERLQEILAEQVFPGTDEMKPSQRLASLIEELLSEKVQENALERS